MTIARSRQIDLGSTPYYHLTTRCVRRAFLCGYDKATQTDYSARRVWIIERLSYLGKVFCVDLAGYALMSNHIHLLVRIDRDLAKSLTDQEVVGRIEKIWSIPELVSDYLNAEDSDADRHDHAKDWIAERRERLYSVSYFMGCLSEYIARRANGEDGCKGRFFEGRFKSQALLDEKALLTCLAYIDLNPVRAGIDGKPEQSEFTSIRQRVTGTVTNSSVVLHQPSLIPFRDKAPAAERERSLPMMTKDYYELVDATGRAVHPNKRGSIPSSVAPILQRIGHDEHSWLLGIEYFGENQYLAMGAAKALREFAEKAGKAWCHGVLKTVF